VLFINTLGKKKETDKFKICPLLFAYGIAVLLGRLVNKSCQPVFS